MAEEKKLFHKECRAAGWVFKTPQEWLGWLEDNKYDTKKPVATVGGFQYSVNDVCLNPNKPATYRVGDSSFFEVLTAKTQYGWVWGYRYSLGTYGSASPAAYPSRYDDTAIFYGTESEAAFDALSFIARQIEAKKPMGKDKKILLWAAKKLRADIVHPQQELFT